MKQKNYDISLVCNENICFGACLKRLTEMLTMSTHNIMMSHNMRFPTMWYFDKCIDSDKPPFNLRNFQMMLDQ